jgi:hypothetical protein
MASERCRWSCGLRQGEQHRGERTDRSPGRPASEAGLRSDADRLVRREAMEAERTPTHRRCLHTLLMITVRNVYAMVSYSRGSQLRFCIVIRR